MTYYDKMKILTRHLNSFIAYARIRNIPVQEILAVMKDPPADLQDPLSTVDVRDYYKVVEFISTSLCDELLGLRVGNFVHLNHLGAIYEITLKTTTVEEALFYCRTYLQRTFPLARVDTVTSGMHTTITLSIDNNHDLLNRIILENMLTSIAREIKVISDDSCEIVVSTPFHHPDYPPSWTKGACFSIVFSKTVLKAALKDNSHWGFDILLPAYLSLMESLDPDASFSNKIKLTVLNMANPCLPDLGTVSGAFNMTPRTLQRRLSEEGITFRQVSEKLKRNICDLLIRHDRYSILDISYILGYSEAAAFIRSFKKWHGVSPAKMKESIIENGLEK